MLANRNEEGTVAGRCAGGRRGIGRGGDVLTQAEEANALDPAGSADAGSSVVPHEKGIALKKTLEKLTERLRSEEGMAALVLFSVGQILKQAADGHGFLSLRRIARRGPSNLGPQRQPKTTSKENDVGKRGKGTSNFTAGRAHGVGGATVPHPCYLCPQYPDVWFLAALLQRPLSRLQEAMSEANTWGRCSGTKGRERRWAQSNTEAFRATAMVRSR